MFFFFHFMFLLVRLVVVQVVIMLFLTSSLVKERYDQAKIALASQHIWQSGSSLNTVEPLYNEVLSITNDFLYPINIE